MHAYIATTIEIDQTAYARGLSSLCISSHRLTRLSGMRRRTQFVAGRPINQITKRVKNGESALPASVVQCMSESMPEEDRSALHDQMERDAQEEWIPFDEGNAEGDSE